MHFFFYFLIQKRTRKTTPVKVGESGDGRGGLSWLEMAGPRLRGHHQHPQVGKQSSKSTPTGGSRMI